MRPWSIQAGNGLELVYMFRTLFTCGYYQYTENILWPGPEQFQAVCVCLFLHEACGLELYLWEVLIIDTVVTHTYEIASLLTKCSCK